MVTLIPDSEKTIDLKWCLNVPWHPEEMKVKWGEEGYGIYRSTKRPGSARAWRAWRVRRGPRRAAALAIRTAW